MNVSPPIAPKPALIPPSTASSSTNSSRRSSQVSSSSYDMEGADHFGFVPVGVLMQQRNADGGESIHHTPSPQTPPPPPPTSQPPSLSHTPPPAPLHAPPPPTLEQVSVAKLASAPSSNHPQPSTAPSLIPTSDILAAVGPKLTEWQSSAPQIQRNNQDALMAAMSTTEKVDNWLNQNENGSLVRVYFVLNLANNTICFDGFLFLGHGGWMR